MKTMSRSSTAFACVLLVLLVLAADFVSAIVFEPNYQVQCRGSRNRCQAADTNLERTFFRETGKQGA